jgi:hypothetical protein
MSALDHSAPKDELATARQLVWVAVTFYAVVEDMTLDTSRTNSTAGVDSDGVARLHVTHVKKNVRYTRVDDTINTSFVLSERQYWINYPIIVVCNEM